MSKYGILLVGLLLVGCGRPDGITEEEYNKYKEFGAPKLLYSCTYKLAPKVDSDEANRCNSIADERERGQCWNEVNSKTKAKEITDVGYSAGVGAFATYNKMLEKAKDGCNGNFKILDKKES